MKTLKTIAIALVIFMLAPIVFTYTVNAAAPQEPTHTPVSIYLNGEKMDTTAYVEAPGTTYAPLSIINALGYAAIYDPATHGIVIPTDKGMILTDDLTERYYINGELKKSGRPRIAQDGTAYIPLTAIARELGYTVEWKNNRVEITGTVPTLGNEIKDISITSTRGNPIVKQNAHQYGIQITDWNKEQELIKNFLNCVMDEQSASAIYNIINYEQNEKPETDMVFESFIGQENMYLGNGIGFMFYGSINNLTIWSE